MQPSPIESAVSAASAPAPSRKAWKWALRLALGLLIVAALLRGNPAASVWPLLRRVSLLTLPAAVALYEIGQFISAARWRLLLRAMRPAGGSTMSMGETARVYFAGMFWNLWMPTGIGGDAFRAYAAGERLGSESGGWLAGASSVLLDRIVGLCGLIGVCALGLAVDARGGASSAVKVLWAVIAALLLLAGIVWAARGALRRQAQRHPQHRWWRRWNEIEGIAAPFGERRARQALYGALGISLVVQALQIAINIGLARVVGLTLPATTFLWLGPSLALSSLLPLGIGGLGVREAAAVALLQGSGAPTATIIAWSLLWQATLWLSSLPGALWAFKARSS